MVVSQEFNTYDFIKDTEIAMAINHYDKNIATYLSNDPNYGFNISYLFWSILTAMIASQVLLTIYWILHNSKPQFFRTDQDTSRFMKVLVLALPFIPGILPIFVLCEIIATKIKLEFKQTKLQKQNSFNFEELTSEFTKRDLENFITCCKEKKELENLRSDIKCIEIFSETYLQLIFQAIMLL